MKPMICVSIVEREFRGVLKSAKKAKLLGADLLELRLDFLSGLDDNKVVEVTKKVRDLDLPVILTIRGRGYGGKFQSKNEKEQLELLLSGARYVDFVDIELETNENLLRRSVRKVKKNGTQVIVSSHNLKETPDVEKILSVLDKEKKLGADVCKFVGKANKIEDNLKILSANLKFKKGKKVVFCSGKFGKVSRTLAPFFGSEWTFASLERWKEAMPGQLDISTLRNVVSMIKND